jgi:hypothetical protein
MVEKIYENSKKNIQSERKTRFLAPKVITEDSDVIQNLMPGSGIRISEVI